MSIHHPSLRHILGLSVLISSMAFVVACDSDPSGLACPEGQTFRNGRCVNDGGGGRGPGSGLDVTEPDVDTDRDADDGEEDSYGPLPDTCEPGATTCESATELATCDADGDSWQSEACPSGERCEGEDGEAACVMFSGTSCNPGQFLGCEGPSRARFCSSAGFSDGPSQECPDEAPNCMAFTQGCTDLACAPDRYFCDNDQVRSCNADGTDSELIEVCAGGCEGGECIDPCLADYGKDSYVGCDFWTVYTDNYHELTPAQRKMAVTVSNASDNPVDATLFSSGGDQITQVNIAPGSVQRVDIPLPNDLGRGTRIDSNSLWRLETTGPVTIHQFNPPDNQGQYSNDASLLLPSNTWGEDYMVMAWGSMSGQSNNRATVTIIAGNEDETVVNITATADMAAGGGQPAISAGTTQEYRLQQGQALHLETVSGNHDPTGTRIRSSQPVAVFSGNQCANIPHGTSYCDHVESQLFPISTWGNQYAVAKLNPRGQEDDIIKVVALQAGTIIQTDPMIPQLDGRTLGAGEVIQVATRQDFILTANHPVSVGQFMVGSGYGCSGGLFGDTGCRIPRHSSCGSSGIGDPAFLVNKAISQFLSEFVFYVPGQYRENSISVITRRDADVRLNGSSIGSPDAQIPGTIWGVWRQAVPEGVNTLSSSSPAGLYVYGYDCDVSYAYPGGADLSSE